MKKSELKVVMVIVVIILLLLVWAIVWKNGKNNKEINAENQIIQKQENVQSNEEFVQIKQDGTKVNTSNKLREEKTLDGLKIKNIVLETKGNETILTATVENLTNQTKGDYGIQIIAKDENGNNLKVIAGYLNTITQNQSTVLRIKTSFDFANTYDLIFKKQ